MTADETEIVMTVEIGETVVETGGTAEIGEIADLAARLLDLQAHPAACPEVLVVHRVDLAGGLVARQADLEDHRVVIPVTEAVVLVP